MGGWYSKTHLTIPDNIKFGRWHDSIDILDRLYSKLGTRLIIYTTELGTDPYNRHYNFEPLIDFAIKRGIANCSIDYIYRHFVYQQLSMVDQIDIQKEEETAIIEEFKQL